MVSSARRVGLTMVPYDGMIPNLVVAGYRGKKVRSWYYLENNRETSSS